MSIKDFNNNAIMDFSKYELENECEKKDNNYKEDETDLFLEKAIETVIEMGQASASFIQRRFNVGYAQASRIIDKMESMGIISSYNGSIPRQVLVNEQEWNLLKTKLRANPRDEEKIKKNITLECNTTTNNEKISIPENLKVNASEIPNILVYKTQGNIIEYFMDNVISKNLPEELKVLMLNIDLVSWREYNELPHFIIPIITDIKKCNGAIAWLKQEMTNRYEILNKNMLKNIESYNENSNNKLSRIIIIIDEIMDILKVNYDETENEICNLLSRGRNVGIQFIIASKYDAKYMNLGKMLGFVDFVDEETAIEIVRNKAENATEDMIDIINELKKIDSQMDGFEFEKYSKQLLRANGFERIDVTKSSGDYGADVIAYKDDIKYAIQCKKYSQPVGISAVQEVIASKLIYKCHVAVVLTNNTFSDSAKELAEKNNVLLWDRQKLKKLINKC